MTDPSAAATNDPTALGRGFRSRLRSGDALLGGTVAEYLRPSLVKLYRQAGIDFLFLEKEHSLFNGVELSGFIQSARDNRMPIVAKIGELNRAETARLLDTGVAGIQLPRTESPDQLRALVDIVKYPPVGTRAGAMGGNVDFQMPGDKRRWLEQANESTIVVAHIETLEGYRQTKTLVQVPHVDMVFVGLFDLSISLGHPGEYEHPKVATAVDKILDLCLEHHVAFGTGGGDAEAARHWIRRGARFYYLEDEWSYIRSGATGRVAAIRRTS